MKKTILNDLCALILISGLLVLVTACSDDKTEATKSNTASTGAAVKTKAVKTENTVDYGEASDSVKNKFIKTFAQNCVNRELKNSTNKENDEKRFQQSCDCIAGHIAEDLAEIDAEKYLEDHEDTQTLSIKFDSAAFFCLQNKPQPKGPHLFGRQ